MKGLVLLGIVSIIALALGVWHAQIAIRAIFVFKENEPLTSWLAIALGPATTLLASLVSIFFRRVGGMWLMVSGIVAFTIFAIGEAGFSQYIVAFLVRISLPMIFVGAAFLGASRFMAGRRTAV